MSATHVAVYSEDPLTRAGLISNIERSPQLALTTMRESTTAVVAVGSADSFAMSLLRSLSTPANTRFVLVVEGGWHVEPSVAAEHGVRAVLWRAEISPAVLLQAVQAVAAGHAWLPPVIQRELLEQIEYVQRVVLHPRGLSASGLTSREIDVLRLVSEGLDLSEIAVKMSYSERTIKKILSAVLRRLGLRNRVHAVSYAIRAGII
ncbi:response regulator transcription factor [Streptomyces sp. NBC_01549]|uniref:response regulator transcription factor n=1 Tax=unclassified Streptomyces TaxID=2593676 RepID=UPI0022563457|nr:MULTISPECIES: response regulator transcription factor [unclassified Streptomyces]MCX4406013.1 response regulator transcription factor [Streptomyces sp. NBC_01764]MCX4588210.1 response regulator transcription factor [Streptomyces sp. NBC_01549]MCX5189463.1 response regulator transcription factor [Streptomyces sp. NBC_00268]